MRCALELLAGAESDDSGAAAADVRLYNDWIAKSLGSCGSYGGVVDDACAGMRETQLFEDLELKCFRDLDRKRLRPVNHLDVTALQISKPIESEERRLGFAAQISRRARAIEYEGKRNVVLLGIVHVGVCIDAYIRNASPVELREKRLEPVRVFVENGDRSVSVSVILFS